MNAAQRTLTTTRRLVAASVALAGAAAIAVQVVSGAWPAAFAALLASGLWVTLRGPARTTRRPSRTARWIAARADLLVQGSFVVLGVLLFAGLAFRLFPVAVVGMWLLVCATDLDRLLVRYPVDSPARVQRETLRRHLKLLGFVGAAACAVAGITVFVAIEVRLPAVILIAVFVVVMLVRIAGSISRGGQDEPVHSGDSEPE